VVKEEDTLGYYVESSVIVDTGAQALVRWWHWCCDGLGM